MDGNAAESDHGSNNGQDGSNTLTIRMINMEMAMWLLGALELVALIGKALGMGQMKDGLH